MNVNILQCNENFDVNSGLILAHNLTINLNFGLFDKLSNYTTNRNWISNSDIVKSGVYLQFLGMPNFEDIAELSCDTLFTNLIGTISPETYRQRFDLLGREEGIHQIIDEINASLLRKEEIDTITINGKKYYTLDIDVTPFEDNSHKESIAYTYKKHMGYAPIMAYLGKYALKFDLRPGNQHSAKGSVEFLESCFDIIEKIGIPLDQILVRVDSGHDDSKFMNYCEERGVKFIVKRNLHGKDQLLTNSIVNTVEPVYEDKKSNYRTYNYIDSKLHPCNFKYDGCSSAYRVVEKYKDESNQGWLIGSSDLKREVEGYWTNLDLGDKNGTVDINYAVSLIVDLYHKHAESEQYHSEVKTDMNLELLPSKYFSTNSLFLQLAVLAFNMLRMIGKIALATDDNLQPRKSRRVKRLRLGTVIKKICRLTCRIVTHAREMTLKFGRTCFLFSTFNAIYQSTLKL